MDYHKIELRVPKVRMSRNLLPTPGSVIFTLLMVGLLAVAQTVGALPLLGRQQAPASSTSTIAYQGRLADASGTPLTGSYSMTFRLYNVPQGGVPLWEELRTSEFSVNVSDGLFNIMLGSVTPIGQDIITDNSNLYLGIAVGSDSEMLPRVQLGSVPYATQALVVPDNSISTAKVTDAAITTAKIADGAVGAADLAAAAVGTTALTDLSVTGAKIADGAITADKLAPNLSLFPSGAIVMWSGSLTNLPSGWVLCNGSTVTMNNGNSFKTPDLRDRFIVGAGASYAVDATGGAAQVTLTIEQMPSHAHGYSDKYTNGERDSGSHAWDATYDKNPRYSSDNKTTGNMGGGQAHENRPPYYSLAFIMKL